MEQRNDYLQKVTYLKQLDSAYYDRSTPEVPDTTYDVLLQQLKDIEAAHPDWVVADSPTQVVRGSVTRGGTQHVEPMLSIDNVFHIEDVVKRIGDWTDGVVLEPKVDGMSIDLCYVGRKLVRALTRGNGTEGENVTHNVDLIDGIPLQLDASLPSEELHIRGEICMTFADFDRWNEALAAAGKPLKANPRNAASGAMRQMSRQQPEPELTFVPYQVIGWPTDTMTQIDLVQLVLPRAGFVFPRDFDSCLYTYIDSLLDAIARFEGRRAELSFPVDGCVIKLNLYEHRKRFAPSQGCVRWAYAFKYPQEAKISQLQKITVQISRTGAMTPVAELEPTLVQGSVIRRASLHNFEYIKVNDIREGDLVKLIKAGEIIPQIVGVHLVDGATRGPAFEIPQQCPLCQGTIGKKTLSDGTDSVAVFCENEACPGRIESAIVHWCRKDNMDLDGVGEWMVHEMVQNGMRSILDLYTWSPSQFAKLPSVGDRRKEKLVVAIYMSRSRGMARVLNGLGIPGLGDSTARSLALRFRSVIELMEQANLENLAFMGKARATKVLEWLQSAENQKLIRNLQRVDVSLDSKDYNPEAAAGFLAGKVFVFTGELRAMDRPRAQDLVTGFGGRCTGSVSKKTTHVVAGNEPGSKLTKAQELGITIMDEAQFLHMLDTQTL